MPAFECLTEMLDAFRYQLKAYLFSLAEEIVLPENRLQIAQIVPNTAAEGPGRRQAIWFQGCPLRCPGCCNPEMLSFKGGVSMTVEEILAKGDTSVEGITLLGGEPFAHASGAVAIAQAAKERNLSVMIFSGFTLEELREKQDDDIQSLLSLTDILVDGPYLRDEPEVRRRWIGSRNQRIHFLSDRYSADDECWKQPNTLELRLDASGLSVNGFPSASNRDFWRRTSKNRNELPPSPAAESMVHRALYGATISERRVALAELQSAECTSSDILLIREAVHSQQFETRRRAAELISVLGQTVEVVNLIETVLNDPMWTVREVLLDKIAESVSKRQFVERILELAEDRTLGDSNELVRASALRIIFAWTENEQRVNVISRMLLAGTSGNVARRMRAIQSLCQLFAHDTRLSATPLTQRLNEILKSCIHDSHRKIRKAAIIGLMHCCPSSLTALPWLLVRVFDAETGVAAAARRALEFISNRINAELYDKYSEQQRECLNILLAVASGSTRMMPPEDLLIQLLNECSEHGLTIIETELMATFARREQWASGVLGLTLMPAAELLESNASTAAAMYLEHISGKSESNDHSAFRTREAVWLLGKTSQLLVDLLLTSEIQIKHLRGLPTCWSASLLSSVHASGTRSSVKSQ